MHLTCKDELILVHSAHCTLHTKSMQKIAMRPSEWESFRQPSIRWWNTLKRSCIQIVREQATETDVCRSDGEWGETNERTNERMMMWSAVWIVRHCDRSTFSFWLFCWSRIWGFLPFFQRWIFLNHSLLVCVTHARVCICITGDGRSTCHICINQQRRNFTNVEKSRSQHQVYGEGPLSLMWLSERTRFPNDVQVHAAETMPLIFIDIQEHHISQY